jgi:hypothetical protein
VRPLLRKYGLERPPRLDPATGVPRAGAASAISDATLDPARRGARQLGADTAGASLIAAELPAHAAAGIQPTLF